MDISWINERSSGLYCIQHKVRIASPSSICWHMHTSPAFTCVHLHGEKTLFAEGLAPLQIIVRFVGGICKPAESYGTTHSEPHSNTAPHTTQHAAQHNTNFQPYPPKHQSERSTLSAFVQDLALSSRPHSSLSLEVRELSRVHGANLGAAVGG